MRMKIKIEDEAVKGKYSDVVRITHTPYTFIIEFAQLIPPAEEGEAPTVSVHTRIVMSPQHAKAMLLALQDNVKKWETSFGEIKLPKTPGKFKPPSTLYQ